MRTYLALGAAFFWVASALGAYWYGTGVGRDGERARQADINQAIEATRLAAQQGAADAISKIKVTNTTIRGKTETIVRENVIYRDCRHDADGVRLINEALTGRPQPPGDSELPGVNAVN